MYVSALTLVDFRSHKNVEIVLTPGSTVFVGANGQGKTNVVEAIDFLARMDSHRVSSDVPLVRFGTDQAIIRSVIRRDDRELHLEMEINPHRANRVRANGSVLTRNRDVIGMVKTVVFSPEDLILVKGDPSDRRRFVDQLVVMRTPRLSQTRADVDRILKQRNALLKSARGRSNIDTSTIDIWDEHLARAGSELILARMMVLDDLAEHLTRTHQKVTTDAAPHRQDVSATYRSTVEGIAESRDQQEIYELLLTALRAKRRDELDRGITLIGPHRDDVVLMIGEMPAKGYASHGEIWSLALSLRLASHELLRLDGDDPILILDDVFAELDVNRRDHLARLVHDTEQVLITAAVAHDVPEVLSGSRFTVQDGTVSRNE